MSFFRRDKEPQLTLEEQAAIDIGKEMATLSAQDLDDFGNRISEFIPLLVAQATRPTTHGLDGVIAKCKYWGKKLLVRRGAAAMAPGSDGLEVLAGSVKALLEAMEKYAPAIQQIFVDRVKRYRAQQAQLARPRLEAAKPAGLILDAEILETKQLGPVE